MVEPTIGECIRELRRPLYTQVDLAVAADVSVDVIRKLEQGRRLTASIGTLQRIARALGVEVAALLGRAHHRLPRLLIGELLTRGRPSARLRALAERLDVRPGTRSQ